MAQIANETATAPVEEPLIVSSTIESDETAPDAETQSSAASEAGDRTTEEGSRAPSDPAEGA